MSQYVGTWVYNTAATLPESVKLLRLDVKTNTGAGWGTAVGLGWTPTLEVRAAGKRTALAATITGSWTDGTEVAATFDIGAATALAPAAGGDDAFYEAQLVMTNAGVRSTVGADEDSETYLFIVKRWP